MSTLRLAYKAYGITPNDRRTYRRYRQIGLTPDESNLMMHALWQGPLMQQMTTEDLADRVIQKIGDSASTAQELNVLAVMLQVKASFSSDKQEG